MTEERVCRFCGSETGLHILCRWMEDEQCMGLLGYICGACMTDDGTPGRIRTDTE